MIQPIVPIAEQFMNKIKIRKEILFNEMDNYATIPKGTAFDVLYWQGINGELCPVVDGGKFVNSIIYFKNDEYKKIGNSN